MEENELQAVISLPAGVFKPYAGVSTAILMFAKGGRTDRVWFYDVEADGRSLDDKRQLLVPADTYGPVPSRPLSSEEASKNNLPDVLARWKDRDGAEVQRSRQDQSFVVSIAEIVESGYELSISRYKDVVHKVVKHDSPKKILEELRDIEATIDQGMTQLEDMLG